MLSPEGEDIPFSSVEDSNPTADPPEVTAVATTIDLNLLISQFGQWVDIARRYLATEIDLRISWLPSWAERALEWVGEKILKGINWIYQQLYRAYSWISEYILKGLNWVYRELIYHFGWLRDQVEHYINSLLDKLSKGYTWVSDIILEGVNRVYSQLADYFGWLRDQVQHQIYSAFGEFWTSITNWLKTAFSTLWDFLSQEFIDAILLSLKWLFERIGEYARGALDLFLGLLEHFSPIVPESGPGIAALFYATATASGMIAHSLGTVGSIRVLACQIPLHYIAGFISEMAGWSRITAASIGVLTSIAVGTPFRYYVNSVIRPWVPDRSALMELLSRGEISTEYWRKQMAYHGIADHYLDVIEPLKDTPLSAFLLPRMAETGSIIPAEVAREVRRRGYAEETQRAVIRWVEIEKNKRYWDELMRAATPLYVEGIHNPASFLADMVRLGVPEEMAAREAMIVYQRYLYNYRKDQKEAQIAAYRAGLIDDQQFIDLSTPWCYSKDEAEAILRVERMRKYGTWV